MERDRVEMLRLECARLANGNVEQACRIFEFVSGSACLGVLKLDEQKSAAQRAVDAMFGHPSCSMSGLLTPRHAIDALDRANLKIVEK